MRYRWPWMNPFEGPSSSGKEKELCDEISVAVDESIEGPSTSGKEKCHHEVHCAVISSLDSCVNCSGPVSSRKWLGLTCKLCSRTWHKTCFMKNEKLVHHSQSLSETQLQQWVSLKKDGTVLCGHCTCKVGLGEVCSHVTALLYAIDSAVKHLEDKSCTDGPRQWGLPPLKAGKALYEEGSGIDFSNPAKKRCGVNHQSQSGYSSVKKVGVSAAAIEQFYKALDNATPNPSEKSGILRILPRYCTQFEPKLASLSLPQPLTEFYCAQNRKLSASDLEAKCDAVFNNMEVTPEQMGM
ncbi:uncharacterized protein [Misgurnus anguillicaudatus]|uniref:uncharacterized protein isoform X2 n=1 Tax=Misgurnus anguillicaudatus TaxID=75329 RepID=UPI003CCF8FAC